ncbi:MAG: penicillin-binding protein 2, partial [Microscillaceae bacterium]|nr:penicillin-binding protein 2 [Microscillaceae bacterium]
MRIKSSILIRARLAFLGTGLVGLIIIVQIVNIQVLQGEQWRAIAREIGLQYRVKKATRGNIYADGGELLATSVPLYQLSIDPTVVSDPLYIRGIDSLCVLLANFFKDKTALEYKRKINDARLQKKRYLILSARLVTYIERKKMMKWPIFREGQLKGGVLFEKAEERTYPFGNLGQRTIGFINANGEGAGLEISLNRELAGEDGRALYQKITGGAWKPVQSSARIRSTDGQDIHTTLNVNIQDIAHQALEKALIRHNASFGTVIVMEVKSGEIKAMANLGKTGPGKYAENYNYAIGDVGSSDPGSTFKTASMMALLEDTTLTLTDTIETGGGAFRYFDRVMRDTRYGGWGRITLQQSLEYSSNIGVSRLITRHFGQSLEKSDKFVTYLKNFGLGIPLDKSLLLEGTTRPYLKTTQDPTWSGVTLPWMSVGYESRLSPLQMLMFYNAIANQGYLVQPRLVRAISQTGKNLRVFEPQVSKQTICSASTLQKIQTMLKGVVLRGTAKNILSRQYAIAGKTGTSQKLNRRGQYTKKYKTSFVGYFPADAPKYSCIVVIDEPQGEDQYGAEVSAPVFREIADRLFSLDVDVQTPSVLRREASFFRRTCQKTRPYTPATHLPFWRPWAFLLSP